MFTRKRFVPPTTKDPDLKAFGKALSDYLISLEAKGSLNISQATIGIDQGLQFPATQVSSTDPNNLDDYEEGTWVPTVTTQVGTLTTVSATGRYTKIGDTYFVTVDIVITTNGTGATAIMFTLPFATTAAASFYGRELGVTGKGLTGTVAASSSSAQIVFSDSTYPGANGATLRVGGFYR